MAKVLYEDQEKVVEDNSEMKKPCEELGVPFACSSGICGTCTVDIVEGEDNLTELSEMEEDLGMDKSQRLSCQCKIKSGDVRIRF
jgi:ferredoxin